MLCLLFAQSCVSIVNNAPVRLSHHLITYLTLFSVLYSCYEYVNFILIKEETGLKRNDWKVVCSFMKLDPETL